MLKIFTNAMTAACLVCFVGLAGCGGAEEIIESPSGNELEQFLADNPDINNAVYEDDEASEEQ